MNSVFRLVHDHILFHHHTARPTSLSCRHRERFFPIHRQSAKCQLFGIAAHIPAGDFTYAMNACLTMLLHDFDVDFISALAQFDAAYQVWSRDDLVCVREASLRESRQNGLVTLCSNWSRSTLADICG
jgi:hypothetical protein